MSASVPPAWIEGHASADVADVALPFGSSPAAGLAAAGLGLLRAALAPPQPLAERPGAPALVLQKAVASHAAKAVDGEGQPGGRPRRDSTTSPTSAGGSTPTSSSSQDEPSEGEADCAAGSVPEAAASTEAVAVAPRDDALQERSVEDLEAEFLAGFLAGSGGSGANRAYFQRLARAAAESAAKGYNVQRSAHIVRRTRVHKTTSRTDMRTMSSEQQTEETEKVEEWVESGAASLVGVGVVCARSRLCSDEYSDGTSEVVSKDCRGKMDFWLGGDSASSAKHKSFNFSASGGMHSPSDLFRQAALRC
mmetsp:Transcript_17454/g.60972  ORF Transcript_17454/g.60972 Transcript_17454/m.60972 type:complete len:307 (-) Transcript_17454:124-1044(-)